MLGFPQIPFPVTVQLPYRNYHQLKRSNKLKVKRKHFRPSRSNRLINLLHTWCHFLKHVLTLPKFNSEFTPEKILYRDPIGKVPVASFFRGKQFNFGGGIFGGRGFKSFFDDLDSRPKIPLAELNIAWWRGSKVRISRIT